MDKNYKKQWYNNYVNTIKKYKKCYSCRRINTSLHRLRCIECSRLLNNQRVKQYNDRKSKGICTRCCIPIVDKRFSRCEECRKILAITEKRYRSRLNEQKRIQQISAGKKSITKESR